MQYSATSLDRNLLDSLRFFIFRPETYLKNVTLNPKYAGYLLKYANLFDERRFFIAESENVVK